MIDVADVVNDPDLAQPFTIQRSTGMWNLGTWQSTTNPVQSYGVITEPTVNEISMVPEGDRVGGVMVFWSAQPIYVTRATECEGGSSDLLTWRNLTFRVLSVKRYEDYGYYRAIAVRVKTD